MTTFINLIVCLFLIYLLTSFLEAESFNPELILPPDSVSGLYNRDRDERKISDGGIEEVVWMVCFPAPGVTLTLSVGLISIYLKLSCCSTFFSVSKPLNANLYHFYNKLNDSHVWFHLSICVLSEWTVGSFSFFMHLHVVWYVDIWKWSPLSSVTVLYLSCKHVNTRS